jgi:hypothetical protein
MSLDPVWKGAPMMTIFRPPVPPLQMHVHRRVLALSRGNS